MPARTGNEYIAGLRDHPPAIYMQGEQVTPDFLNVGVMAMAAAGDYFAQNRPEFKANMQRYYEHVREHER